MPGGRISVLVERQDEVMWLPGEVDDDARTHMTPWWGILVSGLASGLLAVVASIGAIQYQQSWIDKRKAAAARSQAYLQLLTLSMAIREVAGQSGGSHKRRSAVGQICCDGVQTLGVVPVPRP